MAPRTRLAAVVAAVLCCAAAPADASSTAPLTLGGTVTVSGRSGFVRDVVVPKAATFVDTDAVLRSGGGRYSGFILRKNGEGNTHTIAVIRPGNCLTRGCARPAWVGTWVTKFHAGYSRPPGSPPDQAPVPPGRYRLYLLTDGKPVTATFKLRGLTGRTSITSGRPYAPTIDVTKPSQYAPAETGQLYSSGATHKTDASSTFRYYMAWKLLYGPPKSVNQTGICGYNGDPPASGTVQAPFQYPCGGAASVFPSGQHGTGAKTGPMGVADQYVTTSEYFGIAEDIGHTSLGGYLNSHVPASSAHSTILWVDFF